MCQRQNLFRLEFHSGRLDIVQSYPISLCDKTATIHKVTGIINHELLVEDGILFVDANHLQILDCPLTRGNAYWKGQRKIHFLTKAEFLQYQSRKHVTPKNGKRSRMASNDYDEDDDEEDEIEEPSQFI